MALSQNTAANLVPVRYSRPLAETDSNRHLYNDFTIYFTSAGGVTKEGQKKELFNSVPTSERKPNTKQT